MKRSKTYRSAAESIDADEALLPGSRPSTLAKANTKAKFDETVDVSVRLGVDPRKADQMVRGTVNLPNGTGKTARVLVFATGDRAAAAEAAGADEVGSDELIEKVLGGYLDFDAVVATPDLMGKVGRLGRVLGPRGLMPNPKTGTVTVDVAKAVTDIKGGKIEFRVDRHANLHFIIGKASFTAGAAVAELLRRAGRDAAAQAERVQGSVPAEDHHVHHDGPRHPGRHQQGPSGSRVVGSVPPLPMCGEGIAVEGSSVRAAGHGWRSAGSRHSSPAWATGLASVLQSVGARRTATCRGDRAWRDRHPGAVPARAGLDGVAFLANVVALRELPLFLVQSVVAASVGSDGDHRQSSAESGWPAELDLSRCSRRRSGAAAQ